jgi:hypothetical protein
MHIRALAGRQGRFFLEGNYSWRATAKAFPSFAQPMYTLTATELREFSA